MSILNLPEYESEFVRGALGGLSEAGELIDCEKLPGDAGNRSYWRIWTQRDQTFLLMVMNQEEVFRSEEAQAQNRQRQKSEEIDFVRVAKEWSLAGIRVPRLHALSPQQDLLLLEDFGSELLYDRRQKESALDFYEKAIFELLRIQSLSPSVWAKERAFDPALFEWECEHFVEYALEKSGHAFRALPDLRKFLKEVVERICSLEFCVAHRDFHSKNICVLPNESVGLIDFQDTLMAPWPYDLASLLRDAYVDLHPSEEQRLIRVYREHSRFAFDEAGFEAMALQRNLKAVGRFYYIWLVKKRPTHLPYVVPCLKKALRSLSLLGREDLAEALRESFAGELKREAA